MKVKNIIRYAVVLLISLWGQHTYSQNSSNKGTDFWIGFMDHIDGASAKMVLYITSDSSTTGTVSIPGQNWSKNFSVTANTMTLVDVPSNSAYVGCSDCIQSKGVNVSSAKPVVVYSHIYHRARSDATLVLPTSTQGKEYHCMSYKQLSTAGKNGFMIIASQDSTFVNITPTSDIKRNSGVHSKGSTYSIMLNKGQVYQGQGYLNGRFQNADISGTKIEVIDTGKNSSCKAVSVFCGSSFTNIGCNGASRTGDNLYQQMFPVNSWGNRFISAPFASRNGELVRVMASEDNTIIKVGTKTYNLNEGQFMETLLGNSQPTYIRGNKPIMTAQFQRSQVGCDGTTGDPSMTILTPIEQTLEDIVVYSSSREIILKNYINIIIPNSGVSSFRIDGKTASFSKITSFPSYSYSQITVNNGNHRLTSDVGFNAIAYGFGTVESYGYAAGANIKDRKVYIDLTNQDFEYAGGLCFGEMAKFKGNNTQGDVKSWEWEFGDGGKDTNQNPTHLYKEPGEYNVIMRAFRGDNDGCSSYDSSEITMHIFKNPLSNFKFDLSCENAKTLFSDSSSVDSPYYINHILWDFGDGKRATGKGPIHVYDTIGTFNVMHVATTFEGCKDTTFQLLDVLPEPKVKFGATDACFKGPSIFTDSSKIEFGKLVKWNWTFNKGEGSDTVQNTQFKFDTSGIKEVSLYVTSDQGCIGKDSSTMTVFEKFFVDFTSTDTCSNISTLFTNNSGPDLDSMWYLWNFGDGIQTVAIHPNHTYSSEGTYDVTLVAYQNDYCSDTIVKQVVANPIPTVNFTKNQLCHGDSTFFNTKTVIKSGSIKNLEWIVDGQNMGVEDSLRYKFANFGDHIVKLIVYSDLGCTSDFIDTFRINPLPSAQVDGNGVLKICKGEILDLSDGSTSTDSISIFNWSFGTVKDRDSEFSEKIDSTGSHSVKFKVTTVFGCSDSTVYSFYVNHLPQVVPIVQSDCEKNNITPSNSSKIAEGSIISWNWTQLGQSLSSSKNPTFKFNSPGNKRVVLIATSDENCIDSAFTDFEIFPSPVAVFGSDTVCEGLYTNFSDASTIFSGQITEYSWDFGDGNQGAVKNPSHLYSSYAFYPVQLIINSDKNCSDTIMKTTPVWEIPTPQFNTDIVEGCVPVNVNFSDLSFLKTAGNILEWTWDFGDGNGSISQNPTHTYSQSGVYDILLKIESDKGCVSEIASPNHITIHNVPVANFSMNPDTPSFLNPLVQFTDQSIGANINSWNWDFGNGDVSSSQSPQYSFSDTGFYLVRLTVIDNNDCQDDTVRSLFMTPILRMFIPNSFTPNGDYINDEFKPGGILQGVSDFTMSIYNRWGELVYTTEDPALGWDGTFKGEQSPMGVYSYKIRYTDYFRSKWFDKSGEIHLIR
jgi:gliding motility-associated-like protein